MFRLSDPIINAKYLYMLCESKNEKSKIIYQLENTLDYVIAKSLLCLLLYLFYDKGHFHEARHIS